MIWLCNILICMQKHSQHNNEERTQFFRKIYLSLYSKWYERVTKGLCVNREPWGPSSQSGAGSHAGILSPKLWLQLTQTSCRTGLYHCLTYTCFLWASHLHRIQPVHSQGYPLIYSTGCTCYLHRCISYLTARPGRRSICYNCTENLWRNNYIQNKWTRFFSIWAKNNSWPVDMSFK